MKADDRAEALLSFIAQDCATKRDRLLREVEAARVALLRQAHRRARQRVRDTFLEERKRMSERIAAAQARLDTRRRIALQHREHAFLAAAWTALPPALRTRWSAAESRQAWIDNVIAEALKALPPSDWRIAHPRDWPADERARLAARLAARGVRVTFDVAPQASAGLRVAAGSTTIDGSLEGLLADRDGIGARILYALEAAPSTDVTMEISR